MTPPPISTPSPSSFTSPTCRRTSLLPSLLLFLVIALSSSLVHASPLHTSNLDPTPLLPRFPSSSLSPPSTNFPPRPHLLLKRADRFVIVNNTDPPTVVNPITKAIVPQGPATDAGGKGLDIPAIIWIAFTLATGVPMALAGIRGWRLSTGVGVGLAGALASWAAISNSLGASGVSDLIVTLIVLGFFLFGFTFGVIPFGRFAGVFCLGFTGGLAFGIRVMILRPGLLFRGSSAFLTNWILIVMCGVLGCVSLIWGRSKRAGLLFACASIGTFLTSLGADLLIHKQAGMSRGLRFLFDRNASHFLDIVGGGYTPPTMALVVIGVSLAATPVLAVAQHFVFRAPFDRREIGEEEEEEAKEEGGEKAGGEKADTRGGKDEKVAVKPLGASLPLGAGGEKKISGAGGR